MRTRYYIMKYDSEEFQLWRVTVRRALLQWKGVNRRYLARIATMLMNGYRVRDGPFIWSCIVLVSGEYEQRYRQQVKLTPNTVYCRQNILTCEKYAHTTRKKGKHVMKDTKYSIHQLLREALAPIKAELGFPEHNPARQFYYITDEVVACADDPSCQQYLDQQAALGPIAVDGLEKLEEKLAQVYPADVAHVIKALKKTKTREPLALISLEMRKGTRLITLVNQDGALLQMDDTRLIELMRQPGTPLLLAYHTKQDPVAYKERTVVFKNNVTGRIIAKLLPDSSRINVVCLEEERDEPIDKGSFIVDADYLICLYVVLERLRDDAEQYRRMKERAEVSLMGIDPFHKLYI